MIALVDGFERYGESLVARLRREQREGAELARECLGRWANALAPAAYMDFSNRPIESITLPDRFNPRSDPMQIDIHICEIDNGYLVTVPCYQPVEETSFLRYTEDRNATSTYYPDFGKVCDGLAALAEKAKADHEAYQVKLAEEQARHVAEKAHYASVAKVSGVAGQEQGTLRNVRESDNTTPAHPTDGVTLAEEPQQEPAFTIGAEPVNFAYADGDQMDEADKRPA